MCISTHTDGRFCPAIRQGDCPIHPLQCALFYKMTHIEGFWGSYQTDIEERTVASMSEEQKRVAAQAAALKERIEKAEREAEEEARKKMIDEARAQKAVNDAKELARGFMKNKTAIKGRGCIWVELQEEAQEMLARGAKLSDRITKPTPGQRKNRSSERETVENALKGCHAASQGCCPFCNGLQAAAASKKPRRF